MGIADELQQLEQLRLNGTLTEAEFAQAKAQLLTAVPTPASAKVDSFLVDQLAEVRFQNELARIDREWEIERRQYQMVGRYGRVFTPTIGTGIATALVGGVFGVFWTVLAVTITQAATPFDFGTGTYSIVKIVFPLIGIVLTVTAIGRGIYCWVLAQNYNVAFEAYKQRHREASSGQEPK